jgi:hypothetical protein
MVPTPSALGRTIRDLPDVLLRAVPGPDDGFKLVAVTRNKRDLDSLPHPARLAYQPLAGIIRLVAVRRSRRGERAARACAKTPSLRISAAERLNSTPYWSWATEFRTI